MAKKFAKLMSYVLLLMSELESNMCSMQRYIIDYKWRNVIVLGFYASNRKIVKFYFVSYYHIYIYMKCYDCMF